MAASERRVFFRRDKVDARDGKYDEYGSERSKSAISNVRSLHATVQRRWIQADTTEDNNRLLLASKS